MYIRVWGGEGERGEEEGKAASGQEIERSSCRGWKRILICHHSLRRGNEGWKYHCDEVMPSHCTKDIGQ